MFMNHLSGGLRGIRLRGRLLTAFLLMSVLITLCGFAGLTFVNRIGSTVEVATGVAAPLANDSAALLAGARRAREVLRAAWIPRPRPPAARASRRSHALKAIRAPGSSG